MGSGNYDAPRHALFSIVVASRILANIFKQLQYAYFPVRNQAKMHCEGREYDEMGKH